MEGTFLLGRRSNHKRVASQVFVFCLLVAVSCEKEERGFTFTSEGGSYDFVTELDGSSMKVYFDDGTSKEALFYGNASDMEHSEWVIQTDWIRVGYKPTTQHVYVGVLKNTTGKPRSARLTAVKNGRQVVIANFQQQL